MTAERQGPLGRRKGSVPSDTRARILEGAAEVVVALGANALTLDAVVKQTGISKGGLLYHFPNKRALIQGMVTWYVEQSEAAMREAAATSGETGIDGDIRATIAIVGSEEPGSDQVGSALFAAIASDLDLLSPVRDKWRAYVQSLKGARIGFEKAAIVELAINGLQFLELLRLEPFDTEERAAVIRALDRMAKGEKP